MTNENERVQSWVLGDVEVIRLVEWHQPFLPTSEFLPDVGADVWRDNERWLAPDHWRPESDRTAIALQSWVLRSAGRTVLIDTGAGDGRERPGMAPYFHRCQGNFPGLLARAACPPAGCRRRRQHPPPCRSRRLEHRRRGRGVGTYVPQRPLPHPCRGRLPLRPGQRVRERRPGRRPPDLRGQRRAHPPGLPGPAVGGPPPHRRTSHPGVRSRPHPGFVRAATRVGERPGGFRRRSGTQPGADPPPLLQQQLLPGPGGGGLQPPPDPRAGGRRAGAGRPRALRWRGRPGSPTRRRRLRPRPLGDSRPGAGGVSR